ncbi:putative transmembrane protein [Candidatus Burkholderia humilis]|nr:putative transmembrane protein [Candidatus Burkholderia humilis]
MTTTCRRWDPQVNAAPDYYAVSANPVNAVKVTATRTVNAFFIGPSHTVSATAVAHSMNIGAFTIGTTLAAIGQGPLNGLLNALLGTSLNLTVASYQGLADARVKIGDLVTAAGVGTVDQLLGLNLTAAQIAKLMLNALTTTQVANANLSAAIGAMQTIVNANIPGAQTIALGKTATKPGLLSVALANTQSALDATISPLDALLVTAEVAKAGQAAVVVNGGLNLLGISAGLKVQIVQPPVLAIGEAGKDASGNWRTIASAAQVRAFLDVSVGTVPLGQILGGDSSALLHLPLYVEVAPGTAWLQATQCKGPPALRTSTIGVQSGVADVCVGNPPANMGTTFVCNQPATLLNAGALVVTMAASLPAKVPQSAATTLTFDGIAGNSDDYQTMSAAPGATLAYALSGLSNSLSQPNGLTITSSVQLLNPVLALVQPLVLGVLTPVLATILAGFDQVLVPVLQLLGAQIGVSTIHDLSLTCGESQLTY